MNHSHFVDQNRLLFKLCYLVAIFEPEKLTHYFYIFATFSHLLIKAPLKLKKGMNHLNRYFPTSVFSQYGTP